MRYFVKEAVALAAVASWLSLFVFLLLVTTNTVINVSAVEANGIGVYWDSNCSNKVSSIDWGTLTPGSVKSVVVFIRNEVEEHAYFALSTTNWNPPEASQYLSLGWNYSGQQTNPNETIQTTLTLATSRFIEGISNFSHDIIITASGNGPPWIDFFTPHETTLEAYTGESINFTHVSFDPNGDPLSYYWLLDGVEQATTQNWTLPSDTTAGTHNVTLLVSDPNSLFALQEWIVTISDSFPADINDDDIVDIYDLVRVAIAFGSQPEDNPETPQNESENWNPNADISPPYDIVDIYDVVAVTLHFGETGT